MLQTRENYMQPSTETNILQKALDVPDDDLADNKPFA
jgi:hypothetical protein